jgi:hypothetical protein
MEQMKKNIDLMASKKNMIPTSKISRTVMEITASTVTLKDMVKPKLTFHSEIDKWKCVPKERCTPK